MTIFEFALLRAALQKMTPDEIDTAQGLAVAVEGGSKSAADVLWRMSYRILFDHSRPAPRRDQAMVHTAIE